MMAFLNLEFSSEDVLNFFEETDKLLIDVGFKGLLVFTDELQDTLASYPTRDKFTNDIFNLTDGLLRRNGSYGMLFCMPTSTEILIGDIRPDIIQRMQGCNIFIRAETSYGRQFAKDLWNKYANIYEFEDEKLEIIPFETLDAIGQISSRKDLGAGPRTTIDSIVQAVNFYDITRQPYSPINLIKDFCDKKIAFEEGGKVVAAVSETLESQYVKSNSKREEAIKLISAFPRGCPEEVISKYGYSETIDDLVQKLYTDFLFKFQEGYSLRKLAETRLDPELVFVRLTRDYINRYTEDAPHAGYAGNSFTKILGEKIIEQRQGRSLIGWIGNGQSKYEGTFTSQFPFRKLYLSVLIDQNQLVTDIPIEEIGLWFYLDWHCENNVCGKIEKKADNKAVIHLNLLERPMDKLNIPVC